MPEELKNEEPAGLDVPEEAGVSEEIIREGESARDEEARLLREENERLRAEIERVKSLPMKERLYDHVHVSLRTMDIFIITMIILGIAAVIFGMMK